jgi:hypothetical protein
MVGSVIATPNNPSASPLRPGGASSTTRVTKTTVTIPNPTPLASVTARMPGTPPANGYREAGSPRKSRPATSTLRYPKRPSNFGILTWVSTVESMNAAVASPAPEDPPPDAAV